MGTPLHSAPDEQGLSGSVVESRRSSECQPQNAPGMILPSLPDLRQALRASVAKLADDPAGEAVPAKPAPRATVRSPQRGSTRLSADSIGWYLSSIGRVPLLTPAEEIELAHHVQAAKRLQQEHEGPLSPKQKRQLRMGQKARDRMMAANLRLVLSVAKKYQNPGL